MVTFNSKGLLVLFFQLTINFGIAQPYSSEHRWTPLTYKIFPSKMPNYNVNKIVIFEPFVEYKYFPSYELYRSIWDSTFNSKLALNPNNYQLWPNKKKAAREYFGKQIHDILKKYTDTSIIATNDGQLDFIKPELDSIIQYTEKYGHREYVYNDSLNTYFNQYSASHFVFSKLTFYQIHGLGYRNWNQCVHISFYVFDANIKQVFFYFGVYLNGSTQIYSDQYVIDDFKKIGGIKSVTKIYKKFLKLYTTKTDNK